ncbi:CvpA family protein [Lampropedia puyangensis]|uniref:CvpA family protein n=1 Tax=Lampropedia puyangensis TaxID=1330072 RepID=A0A4S8F955_9BURK|nr:CvpA family protein [Lampropedia puyangensis]THU04030.1 CvpA family protein [Lampropedia puyangensis]
MTLNGFDLAFLMLAFLSVAVGAWRGFIFESISVLGWVLGIAAAMAFGPAVGQWIPMSSLADGVRRVLGMLAVLIVAVFVSSMLASLGRQSAKKLGIRAADRLIGALFGVVRIGLAGVVVAVVVHALQWVAEPWWQGSAVGPVLDRARLELATMLPTWKILQEPEPISIPLAPVLESLPRSQS